LQAGSSTGGAGGSILLKPGGTGSGSVGEVAMQSATGTDLLRVNENAASISAQRTVTMSADSDGGDAAASIVLNSDAATVEIRGTVVLLDTLTMGETMLFGDVSTRMLRYRSASMVQSFTAADPTTVSMDMFGAKVTVFANTGAAGSAMAMAEFMYTRLGETGKLTNYQEVQRGMGLTVAVTASGLTVTTTTDAHITVVSMLMF
jgi:hypothetical protein